MKLWVNLIGQVQLRESLVDVGAAVAARPLRVAIVVFVGILASEVFLVLLELQIKVFKSLFITPALAGDN